jgi:hypothetical protein
MMVVSTRSALFRLVYLCGLCPLRGLMMARLFRADTISSSQRQCAIDQKPEQWEYREDPHPVGYRTRKRMSLRGGFKKHHPLRRLMFWRFTV